MRMNLLEALSDNIVIDKDKCIYCGICVDTCILDNLRMKQAPCARACPLGVNCQGYVQLIGRGRDEDALRVLEEKLPFPEVLSRLCSQPCETRCHCNAQEGQAVNIRGLKRYLTEQVPVRRSSRTGLCACDRAGRGHRRRRPGRADGRLRPAAPRAPGGPRRRGARTGRHAALGGAGVPPAR